MTKARQHCISTTWYLATAVVCGEAGNKELVIRPVDTYVLSQAQQNRQGEDDT